MSIWYGYFNVWEYSGVYYVKNDDKVKIADNNRIKKPSERVKQFSEDLEISSDGTELLYFCTRCNFYDWNGGYDIATC